MDKSVEQLQQQIEQQLQDVDGALHQLQHLVPYDKGIADATQSVNHSRGHFQEYRRASQAQDIIDNATTHFWASIADQHPEIKSGDLTPNQVRVFDDACMEVVTQWLKTNTVIVDET